jgi:hypothetical protein
LVELTNSKGGKQVRSFLELFSDWNSLLNHPAREIIKEQFTNSVAFFDRASPVALTSFSQTFCRTV